MGEKGEAGVPVSGEAATAVRAGGQRLAFLPAAFSLPSAGS